MRNFHHFIFAFLIAALLAVSGTGCSKAARSAKFMKVADQDFAAGNYDRAEIEYINSLHLNPASARAFGQMGIMSFEQGRLARAYQLLHRALQLDPNNVDYHREMALFYMVARKSPEATQEALFVLEHNPQDEQAPLILVEVATTPKDLEAARQRLQSLVVPADKRAPVESALGSIYARQHDFKSADAAYQRAKAANPNFSPLYAALSGLYLAEKDMKQAEEAFKRASDLAPVRSTQRLRYAQFKLQSGDVPGAKGVLEDALEKAPDFNPAAMVLAEIAASDKKFDEANKLLAGVLSRDPQSYDAMLLNGRVAMAQGDAARAAAEFDKMLKTYPKSSQVLYQLALAHSAVSENAKAASDLNQAIAINPTFTDAVLALSQIKISQGDVSSAIVSLRQLIQQHPQVPQAQLLLADAYKQQGNLADALKVYRQLEVDYPQNAETHLLEGIVLEQQNQRAAARQTYAKALELLPGYPAALERWTDLDMDDNQFATALTRVESVIAADPKAPEPTLLLAKIYLAQKQLEKAETVLLKTIADHPDFNGGYLMLGRIYDDSHQPQKALDIMYKLLAKHDGEAGAWMVVATIKEAQKDFDAARAAYEKVLTLDPRNSASLNNLACLYAEHDQLEKGYELARRAREYLPYDSSAADTLGWILFKKGQYSEAVTLLRESAAKQPTAPDIQMHLGMACYMMGDEATAEPALQYGVQSKEEFSGKKAAADCLVILAINGKTAGPDARATLEKRLASEPGDSIAASRLAAMYQREGAAPKAIETYEVALKSNPKNVRVMMELAALYAAQSGQGDKAFTLAKAAYKLAPDDASIGRTLGKLSFAQGDYQRALNLLQEAAQKSGGGDAELAYDLALAEYSCGQVEDAQAKTRAALATSGFTRAAEAKQFLELVALSSSPQKAAASAAQVTQTLKATPDNVPALMAQGLIQEQKPDARAAIQIYEKALQHYPDFVPAKWRLTLLYAQEPIDDKRAYDVAVKAREAYPEDKQLAVAFGTILYRQGNFTRSAQLFDEAGPVSGSDATRLYYLGMSQYQLRQKAESKKNLARAVELKLPDALSAEAKRVLGELK